MCFFLLLAAGAGNQRQQCGEQMFGCSSGLLQRPFSPTLCGQGGQTSPAHQQVSWPASLLTAERSQCSWMKLRRDLKKRKIKGCLFQGLLCALESCGPLCEDVPAGHSQVPEQTGERTCHTALPSVSRRVVFWCFCTFFFLSTAADLVSGCRFWLSVFPPACRWSSEWRRRVWGGFSWRRAA